MTFTEIIHLWPSKADFAADVGEEREAVRGWEHRNSIPGHAFAAIVDAAKRRGISGVTLEVLAAEAAKRKRSSKKSHVERAEAA